MRTQIGKTQMMLTEAMAALRESHVAVVAANHMHARELFARLRNMLGTSGDRQELVLRLNGHYLWVVTPRSITKIGPDTYGLRCRASAKVFIDHFVFESGALS